jgi:dipeptidyl aminopeptidase/acylaminoacyl peptidase
LQDQLLDKVAFLGGNHLRGPVRGIVLRFSGLGATALKGEADPMEMEWGDAGGLVVLPYYDPWAWMNPATRAFVDELVDGVRARYKLDPATPVIATGGSMGGHAALAYSMFTRHKVAGCMALCPVCDLAYHYTERPDLPRTLHQAFGSYGDIQAALEANSPCHQIERLPDIPYLIVHGAQDQSVAKARHSDKLVAALRARGLKVNYWEQPGMGHCQPLNWPLYRAMTDFVLGLMR